MTCQKTSFDYLSVRLFVGLSAQEIDQRLAAHNAEEFDFFWKRRRGGSGDATPPPASKKHVLLIVSDDQVRYVLSCFVDVMV